MNFKECFFVDGKAGERWRWRTALKMYLFSLQYRVIVTYRVARFFMGQGCFFCGLGRLLLLEISKAPGIEINSKHDLGKRISFPHPHDIVIGGGAHVGCNVTIYNGVTIGAKDEEDLDMSDSSKYPIIEDGVIIYPGARVIGSIRVGKGCRILANSVVLESCPQNAVVGGIPAIVLSQDNAIIDGHNEGQEQ
jgi:serine O-acetyltransferase